MAFPPEKNEGFLDTKHGKNRETEAPPSSRGPSPTFPPEKAPTPPLIRLEYHPESSSSSRAIIPPTFPTPFDSDNNPDNNPPPPSYYSDGFANRASSSHFAPASSTTNAAMFVPSPMLRPAPGGPPSFARAPSREVTYPSFPPMFLVATGKTLAKGFPFISPPSNSNPHPFASHDVYELDWMRYFSLTLKLFSLLIGENLSFLHEAQMVAALSPKQIELSEHLPILSIVPIVSELQIKVIV